MTHARRCLPLLLAAALLSGLGACRSDDIPFVTGDARAEAVAELERAERPRLRDVGVVDSTPPEMQPPELSLDVEGTVAAALRAPDVFGEAPDDGSEGCVAEVAVIYTLTVNGEVAPGAEAGEARMAIEGHLYCPRPDEALEDTEAFRATVEADREFGPGHGLDAGEALEGMLEDLAPRVAQRIYGQALVRHASDRRVLEVLAEEERPGLLMEAASEAGERKLEGAVPHLARLTSHEDEVVVLRAGAALGLIGAGDTEVLRALASMTEGSDAERHLVAVHALGDIGGAEAARYLETIAVGHPMAPIREAARRAAERARAHAGAP